MKTHCTVPAKLILSGEHAVLYQCPALSMAINLHTHCWTTFRKNTSPTITIELCDFNQTHTLSLTEYRQQATQIEQRYQAFLQGKTTIQTVLSHPIDLVICTLHHFEQAFALNTGSWQFKIQSETPIGRGLGSSAAVILSLLGSLIKQHQQKVSSTEQLSLAQQIEAYQHGQSSGIDPATLIQAGLLQYQTDQPIQPIISPPFFNAWLIDTGKPDSATGECVMAVKSQHQNNMVLWQAFRTTTKAIATAIQQNDVQTLQQGVRQNHQLLIQIGVVPNHIQHFISALQTQYHAAAKICGAGSISGNHAGVVLCLSDTPPLELCQRYGYPCHPIALQSQGIRCELDE